MSSSESVVRDAETGKRHRPRPEKTQLCSRLLNSLRKGKEVCLICLGRISNKGPIWFCKVCFALTHLGCIRDYVRTRQEKGRPWVLNCPKCGDKTSSSEPIAFTCWCGGTQSFEATRSSPYPFSCWKACPKRSGCSHQCQLRCHPGPCPPCNVNVRWPCKCQKNVKYVMCNVKQWTCEQPCNATKPCGHTCLELCHDGDCSPCEGSRQEPCFCRGQAVEVLCATGAPTISCGKPCHGVKDCGLHHCENACHPGPCGPCEAKVEFTEFCPCGKFNTNFLRDKVGLGPRTSCKDQLLCCDSVCGRSRSCGHLCTRKCHFGKCESELCQEQTIQTCRCGSSVVRKACESASHFLCNECCGTLKSCGVHFCETVCCPYKGYSSFDIGPPHICSEICNKTLPCEHACGALCHRGACPPCSFLYREGRLCPCGSTVFRGPIRCHESQGACSNKCNKELLCSHRCLSLCHHGDCPPCTALINSACAGGHSSVNIQCGLLSRDGWICRRQCNKLIHTLDDWKPSGPRAASMMSLIQPGAASVSTRVEHKCMSLCHSNGCPPCTNLCGKTRPDCKHKCGVPCHGDSKCPLDTPCEVSVSIRCSCGRQRQEKTCFEAQSHSGLLCDELCVRYQRQEQLRKAFLE